MSGSLHEEARLQKIDAPGDFRFLTHMQFAMANVVISWRSNAVIGSGWILYENSIPFTLTTIEWNGAEREPPGLLYARRHVKKESR